MPEQGPGFYGEIMVGRPVALFAALLNVAVGKSFRSKKRNIKNYNFSTFAWAYVRFPGYWTLSPSVSFKRGLAT